MKAVEFVKKFGWGEFKELYQASLYVEPFQPPSEKIIGIKNLKLKSYLMLLSWWKDMVVF